MKQILLAGTTDPMSVSANDHTPFTAGGTSNTFQSTETSKRSVIPYACTLRNLVVRLDTAPGVGKSYQFIVIKNGNTTTLTATVSDTNTQAVSAAGTDVTFAAGDTLSLRSTPSGTPTAVTQARWSVEVDSGSLKRFMFTAGINANINNAGLRQYTSAHSSNNAWTTLLPNAKRYNAYSPMDCTIRELYVALNGTPGVGTSYTFSIFKNGSEEVTSQVVISGASTTGSVTGLSIDVVPTDTLVLSVISAGVPTARLAGWGVGIEPDNDGESMICGETNSNLSTTLTQVAGVNVGGLEPWVTSEPSVLMVGNSTSFVLKKFYINLSVVPGSGKSRAFRWRKDSANGNNLVTVSDLNASGTDLVNSDVFGINDISFQTVPTNTPVASLLSWSAVMFISGFRPKTIVF